LVLSQVVAFSQSKITLQNSSFEKINVKNNTPQDWFVSTFYAHQAADVQPNSFNVTLKAKDGARFISLKTNKDGGGYIGQTFEQGVFMRKDSFYSFSVDLAFSKVFFDTDSIGFSNKKRNYPAYLAITGSNSETHKYELLDKSELIENTNWQTHNFTLLPTIDDFNQIQLIILFSETTHAKNFGHLLLDNCSDIELKQNSKKITLTNPSFEDIPKCCTTPWGWYNVGDGKESPPDTQPGFFSVDKKAQHGSTYLGMVTRDNNTSESISQRLSNRMFRGKTYIFSIDLAQSKSYESVSRTTGEPSNYIAPSILNIWGGNSYGEKAELLSHSEPISNTNWQKFNFHLSPQKTNYSFITLEAAYGLSKFIPQNGNILLDNCSDLILIEK
jgi:hypothetical protein